MANKKNNNKQKLNLKLRERRLGTWLNPDSCDPIIESMNNKTMVLIISGTIDQIKHGVVEVVEGLDRDPCLLSICGLQERLPSGAIYGAYVTDCPNNPPPDIWDIPELTTAFYKHG